MTEEQSAQPVMLVAIAWQKQKDLCAIYYQRECYVRHETKVNKISHYWKLLLCFHFLSCCQFHTPFLMNVQHASPPPPVSPCAQMKKEKWKTWEWAVQLVNEIQRGALLYVYKFTLDFLKLGIVIIFHNFSDRQAHLGCCTYHVSAIVLPDLSYLADF